MLRYELQIFPFLVKEYDIDIWGVSVDGVIPKPLQFYGKKYPIHIFTNVKKGKRIIPNYWRGLKLNRFKKDFREYDIIYIHTGSIVVAASGWKNTKKQLLVYHQHGLQYLKDYSLKTLLQRPFMHRAQRCADFSFIVTGKEEFDQYVIKKKYKKKLVQIGSPIDNTFKKRFTAGVKKSGNTFIYVGRLSPIKRVPMVVKAFDKFSVQNEGKYRLIIVGDGEERALVEKTIEKSDFKENIVLTGKLDKREVEEYLLTSDFYVTASKGEGASIAVLEAYMAGLPVACFPVRGLKEQVSDNITGAVAGDETVDGLVEAMERIYRNKEKLTGNCISECNNYLSETIAARIVKEMEQRYEAKKN